ncbi:MlaD family protein [Spirillospora sp. CA-255316]
MSDAALSARSRAGYAALGATALAAAVTDVKVRGVTVGKVESVALAPDGRVRVRLRVERDVRVPRGAQARIDPVSIFGPKEISLDLGPAAGRGRTWPTAAPSPAPRTRPTPPTRPGRCTTPPAPSTRRTSSRSCTPSPRGRPGRGPRCAAPSATPPG